MEKEKARWAPMDYKGPAECLLARLAAEFPDLVDPTCARARSVIFRGDPEEQYQELLDFLRREIKDITQFADTDLRGATPRVGRLLLDRARNGKPNSPYRKA